MDAEVTESAGTPTGPDDGQPDGAPPDTPGSGASGGPARPGVPERPHGPRNTAHPSDADGTGEPAAGAGGPGTPAPDSDPGDGAPDSGDGDGVPRDHPGTGRTVKSGSAGKTEATEDSTDTGGAGGGDGTGAAAADGTDDGREPANAAGDARDTNTNTDADTDAGDRTHTGGPGNTGADGDGERPPASAHSGEPPALPVEPKVTASGAASPPAVPPDTAVTENAGADAPRPRRHWLRWAALGTAAAVLAGSGTAWYLYRKLDGNITTDTTTANELRTHEKERPVPVSLNAQNILLLGSDSRSGEENGKYGRDDGGSHRADTVILLHIAADRRSSTAVSLPRDLMATVPSCRRPDGTRSKERFTQFNSAFSTGGAACTIRTVERMTGIRINHHMVIDFGGFKKMVDAVGGVEVCLKEPVDDPAAKLRLGAGRQTLNGEEALGFVRVRKTLGDGSDTERMKRQQQFLASLVKKVQSNGVLLNPVKLYPLLDAATRSLTTDPGLDSLGELRDLLRSVRSIPTESVQFLTVPRQPYAGNPNRDELVQPKASQLFTQLRDDTPVTVVPRGRGDASDSGDEEREAGTGDAGLGRDRASASGSPTPSPSFTGTNAAVGPCE
jgi:LCP family protein required for cell wall assembly